MSAAEMIESIAALHAKLRGCVDMMGIGLTTPRGDTVAEDRSAESAGAQGDVR